MRAEVMTNMQVMISHAWSGTMHAWIYLDELVPLRQLHRAVRLGPERHRAVRAVRAARREELPQHRPPDRLVAVELGAELGSTGACTINRPCAQQYVGKSQSCMVISGRLSVHARQDLGGGELHPRLGGDDQAAKPCTTDTVVRCV